MNRPFVAVLMGSDSDLPVMQSTLDTLSSLNVAWEVKITSAHRTPRETHDFVVDADARGCGVFIAAAGLAAHLAGTIASITTRPVIGVPLEAGSLRGIDSLLSTVQMPAGIPVACVAIGKAGAKNAAYLAAQIMAVNDEPLRSRIKAERATNTAQVLAKDRALQASLHA